MECTQRIEAPGNTHGSGELILAPRIKHHSFVFSFPPQLPALPIIIMGSASNVLRIASASGSVTDRRHGLAALAETEDVQYIVGDWMSEYNMTTRGGAKIDSNGSSEEFETSFLEALEPALPHLQARKIKVAVNAGASDTQKLYHTVVDMIKAAGLSLTVAWIGGDEVMDLVGEAIAAGDDLRSLTTGAYCQFHAG